MASTTLVSITTPAIDKTAAALTRLASRDELCDVVARLAVVRDELARFAPDPTCDEDLASLGHVAGLLVCTLGKPYRPTSPVGEPVCICGHEAGRHRITPTNVVTVCDYTPNGRTCGCPGWTQL